MMIKSVDIPGLEEHFGPLSWYHRARIVKPPSNQTTGRSTCWSTDPCDDKVTCHPVLILSVSRGFFWTAVELWVSQRKKILTDKLRVMKWTSVIMSATSEFRCQPWHLLSRHQYRNLRWDGGIPPEQPAEYSGHRSHCSCSQMRWIQVKTRFTFKLNTN